MLYSSSCWPKACCLQCCCCKLYLYCAIMAFFVQLLANFVWCLSGVLLKFSPKKDANFLKSDANFWKAAKMQTFSIFMQLFLKVLIWKYALQSDPKMNILRKYGFSARNSFKGILIAENAKSFQTCKRFSHILKFGARFLFAPLLTPWRQVKISEVLVSILQQKLVTLITT